MEAQTQDYGNLLERLEKVEKKCIRLKILVVILGIFAVLLGGISSLLLFLSPINIANRKPDVLKTEKLIAKELNIMGEDGKQFIKLVSPKIVEEKDLKPIPVEGHSGRFGHPVELDSGLFFYDKSGRERIRMYLDKFGHGTPLLHFSDERGRGLVLGFVDFLVEAGDDVPSLILLDKEYKRRVSLSLSADGEPSLNLFDKNGKLRAALGSTILKYQDTGTEVKRPSSSLVLFNEKGDVIWQAPFRD